jgi:uncharacterized protein involved in exopolysaccharide biosynthesis
VAAAAAVAGAAAAAVWFFLPTSKYTARTLLRVPPGGTFLFKTNEPVPALDDHQRTQVALVKSRMVLNQALKESGVSDLETVARAGRRRAKAENPNSEPVDEYLDNLAARGHDPLRRLEACEALERLSPRQAAVATLLDQGYTQAEAASLVGVSLSTVEEDLRKARRFLKAWEVGQER